jgi:integrase
MAAGSRAFQARASAVALKALSTYLARESILDRDVLADVKVPRVDDQTRTELSAEQFTQLVKAAERGRNGVRATKPSSCCSWCAACVSTRRGSCGSRTRTSSKGSSRVWPETSKFRKGRYVTLYPEAADALARYVYDHRDGNREYVFLTEAGTPFTYYGFQRIFRSLKTRSGLSTVLRAHPAAHRLVQVHARRDRKRARAPAADGLIGRAHDHALLPRDRSAGDGDETESLRRDEGLRSQVVSPAKKWSGEAETHANFGLTVELRGIEPLTS